MGANIDDLLSALRSVHPMDNKYPVMHFAANIIEQLIAERDALQAKLDLETHMVKVYKSDCDDLVSQRNLLQEDLSNLEAERDALQAKLNGGVRVYAAKNGLGYGCVQLKGDEAKDHNATLVLDNNNEPTNT